MRASYDSIDNKQKMCEKVKKDITFIQFFHSTRLHSTELFKIFFSLLTLQLLFCKKLVGREIKVIPHQYKMTLKTMTICLHRALLSRKNTLFFVFCSLEEIYILLHGDNVILGLIIFYLLFMLLFCYD